MSQPTDHIWDALARKHHAGDNLGKDIAHGRLSDNKTRSSADFCSRKAARERPTVLPDSA
jgi:hypothetical protein